jgi:predicted transposase YdaD
LRQEQPYDPILKTLADVSPPDWLPLARRRRRRITVVDSDIGTLVSGAADKLFRVHDDPEYLLHLDFEVGHFRRELPLRLRLYNSVFEYRHNCVVLSVPVLLYPEADSPQWTGLLERALPGEAPVSTLRYPVIRVWELPAEQLLTGGVGTLALAPISNIPESGVQQVIQRMKERLRGPQRPRRAADIWTAAYLLVGLRYSEKLADVLFEGILEMEQSSTYQALVRRSRAEEARRMLLLQGETKFGPPDAATRAALESLDDLARLEELGVRLMIASTWQELLASPTPVPARRRRTRG